jgi:Domain of unknown function (DUF4214)
MATTFSGEAAIEALYVGYFGRAGDPSGVNFWINQLNGGMSITAIAASFAVQTESTSMYPFLANPNVGGAAALTNFISQVYQDLFNRAPDASGLAFWTAQLQANSSPQSVGQFILNVTTGAQGTDQTIVQNKVMVAQNFTDTFATSGQTFNGSASNEAHTVVAGTTGATTGTGSVTTQEAQIGSFISGNASTGTPITLTTGIDTVTGSNLAINGVLAPTASNTTTLNVGDQLNPSGNNNSLNIIDTVGGPEGASSIPTLTNIQTLNVNETVGGVSTYTLTGIAPAVTTLGASGIGGVTFQGFSGTQTNTFNVSNINAPVNETFTPNSGLSTGGKASGTATVNVTGAPATASGGNVVIALTGTTSDGFATVNLNSNGTVANDLVQFFDNSLSTLNIAGGASLAIDTSIGFNGGVVAISAAMDTGGLNLNVSSDTGKVTFTGGTGGNETLTISDNSLLATGTLITGGAGTSDTITDASLAGTVTTAEYTALNAIKGFEILGVTTTSVIDDSQLTATFNNHFAVSGAGNLTVNNLVNNATIDIGNSSTDVFVSAVAPNTAITINEGSAASTGGFTDNLTVTGFATVNLANNGSAANVVHFTNSDNTLFNISGGDGLTVTVSAAATTGDTINATSLTGAFTYTDSGKGDVISTGSGTTSITALSNVANVDTITLLAGHTKVDTFTSTAIDTTNTATLDKVTNFALNQDVLHQVGTTLHQGTELGATAGTGVIAPGAFAALSNFITSANATVGATAGDTVAWSDGANTYIAEFTGATANHVHIVDLVGTTGVTSIGGAGAGHVLIG